MPFQWAMWRFCEQVVPAVLMYSSYSLSTAMAWGAGGLDWVRCMTELSVQAFTWSRADVERECRWVSWSVALE